jgi:acetyl-CoA carboxylase beta subunit
MSENKPTRSEDEYFVKQDADLIKAQRARLDEERARAERRSHYMKCPKCGADLQEKEFHHVKVDTCPECKGMWLDAGELDLIKYVDRNAIGRFVGSLFGQK